MNHRLLLYTMLAVLTITLVSAVPSGPTTDIVTIQSERWTTWPPKTLPAIAGNVTEFNTNGTTITRAWQGYYGNITGTITLGDSNNNTLYDWSLANPQGEIYAVRSVTTPDWYNVRCSDDTEIRAEDLALNIDNLRDEDSVNNTFVINGTPDQLARFPGSPHFTHPRFYVANVTIENNSCPLAVMYNSSYMPSPYFKEVLLSDQGAVPIIYTALIAHTLNPSAESDGFNQRPHDFEMIVGEDGHFNDLNPVTYWFYLELE
jgi:hypothetical protein